MTILVLGLGKSGKAAADYLVAQGKEVILWDDSPHLRAQFQDQGYTFLDDHFEWSNVEYLVLSPGIPHTFPAPHPVVAKAKSYGIPLIGDMELFLQKMESPALIAVTGTNGKSTTTSLIGHILSENKQRVSVGGNIGIPVLELPPSQGCYVFEVSSFQLELTPSLHPKISVLLNITPDHIERHGSMEGYITAKKRIFQHVAPGDVVVIGVDDEHSQHIYQELCSIPGIDVIPLSCVRPLTRGLSLFNGILEDTFFGGPSFPVKDLSLLKGRHNWQNVGAAYGAARAYGLQENDIWKAIQTFQGLAHRQEVIAKKNNITYVNDSKATNGEATVKALQAYGDSDILLILGGKAKEDGLTAVEPFFPLIRHAFLIGESAALFAQALEGKVPYTQAHTLEKASTLATNLASSYGRPVILLSPACASYDQFLNFEARGDAFKKWVEAC